MRRYRARNEAGWTLSFVLAALLLTVPLTACSGSKNSSTTDPADPTPLPIVDANQRTTPASTKHLKGTVFLDPGHGGIDEGTSGYTSDGRLVEEKTVVLQIALRLAQRLRADGLTVVMSRASDADPCVDPNDLASDGVTMKTGGVLRDLQCRIDKANASRAQVLLSLHMNAYSDPSVSGTETYYDSARSFASQNKQFAELVQQDVINALHAQRYSTPDRGVSSDSDVGGDSLGTLPESYNHLVMLGPAVPGQLIPSEMPGALCEIFFLSNPSEATAITEPGVQEIIAGGLANAIETFLEQGG